MCHTLRKLLGLASMRTVAINQEIRTEVIRNYESKNSAEVLRSLSRRVTNIQLQGVYMAWRSLDAFVHRLGVVIISENRQKVSEMVFKLTCPKLMYVNLQKNLLFDIVNINQPCWSDEEPFYMSFRGPLIYCSRPTRSKTCAFFSLSLASIDTMNICIYERPARRRHNVFFLS